MDDYVGSAHGDSMRLVDGIDLKELANEGAEFEVMREDPGLDNGLRDYYKNHTDAYMYSNIFETQDVPDDESGDETTSPFEKLAKNMESLTECGGVLKRVLREGVGNPIMPNQIVRFNYNAYQEFQDEPYDSTYLRGSPMVAKLEEGQVIIGLEIALRSMRKLEMAQVMVKPDFAYGERGCPPRIAPNAVLLFQVEVLSVNAVGAMGEIMSMPLEERKAISMQKLVEAASEEREKGNQLFYDEKYGPAMKHYSKGISLLENSQIKDEADERLQQHALVKLYLNAAACKLSMQRYPETINYSNRVLDIDPTNSKALYRKGIAKKHLGDYDAARSLLLRAHAVKPMDSTLAAALKELDESEKQSKITEKEICKKMFGCMSSGSASRPVAGSDATSSRSQTDSDFYSRTHRKLREFADDSELTELKIAADAFTAGEIAIIIDAAAQLNIDASKEGPTNSLLKLTKKP